jgi:hypothetical protein
MSVNLLSAKTIIPEETFDNRNIQVRAKSEERQKLQRRL